jgi:hypothetical protein
MNFDGVFAMECLICEEKMLGNVRECKMCGMGVDNYNYAYGKYLFCSRKCLAAFDNILKVHGKDSEIVSRNIVI